MHDFYKSNKISNLYWLKQPPDDMKIKIRIRPREGVTAFPKFKDYINGISPQIANGRNVDEYTIAWQEKRLSRFQIQQYAVDNHYTNLDVQYHSMIENKNFEQCKIFTYTNADEIMPISPLSIKKETERNIQWIADLNACFSKVNISDTLHSNSVAGSATNSTMHLFKHEEYHPEENVWTSMHILWDNSEYNEDSQLLFKDECLLVSLHYNKSQNQLILSPDVNDLEYNSYDIESESGILGFEYAVELEFEDESAGELDMLLDKLLQKLDKKQRSILNFIIPPLGIHKAYVTFEIVSAVDFEVDKIYVEFNLKISDDIKYTGDSRGSTHTSSSLETDGIKEWCYGHIVDLEFEYSSSLDPPPLKIYFEVISTDWWGRHRTEGYTSLALSLEPGEYMKHLSCSRPEELDTVEAESRRFFVGGCHLIKDLDILENPQHYKTNFRYVTTGKVLVRWNTLIQTHTPGSIPSLPHSSGTDLLRRADDVLRHYNKAKATLAAATRDLTPREYSRDG